MTIFYELHVKIDYYECYKTHIFKTSNNKDLCDARRKVIEYFIKMISEKIIELSLMHPSKYQKDMIETLTLDLNFMKDAGDQFIKYSSYIYGERRFIFTKKDVTEIT